jgi:hypothetical protein
MRTETDHGIAYQRGVRPRISPERKIRAVSEWLLGIEYKRHRVCRKELQKPGEIP